jgi:hypothetical protein
MRQMGVFHHYDPNNLENLWIILLNCFLHGCITADMEEDPEILKVVRIIVVENTHLAHSPVPNSQKYRVVRMVFKVLYSPDLNRYNPGT